MDPYQRIMAVMSAYDVILLFFFFFVGMWMTPRETGWWGAVENVYTYSAQGSVFAFRYLGIPAYQALLPTSTFLTIVYGWTPKQFERKVKL